MSERRFVITDQVSGMSTYWYQRSITETEFKRRINMLTGGDYRDGDINILLYGETVPPGERRQDES